MLYLLDKGYIEHLSGKYTESIKTLEQAKLKFDELYTKSITKIAATWVINDYAAPYHGEDFERIFINIFQALNYLMLGEYAEAMVEARDVDSKLNAINDQYPEEQKNVYKEDAFVRMLMGIFYEAGNTDEDINDAYISNVKAIEIYERDYANYYDTQLPEILKENTLSTARFMGLFEFGKYRSKFNNTKFYTIEEKRQKSEVYLIQYNGISPAKVEESVMIPTLDGNVVKVAFPRYESRSYTVDGSRLSAKSLQGNIFECRTELGQNIGAIARKNLEKRKLRFIAKSTARAAGRYLVEQKQTENIEKKHGNKAAEWFNFLFNIYNIVVEQADLRCWKTLPDQIRISRLILEPGKYEFNLENFSRSGEHLGQITLTEKTVTAGEKVFFLVHTAR
ncbi:MAG: hypothetical protein ABIG64_09610 [Candidatus Omnitrophota bacterium]